MSVAQQGLVLFAAERGYLEDVELAKIGSFEAALLAYVDRDHAPLMQEINQTGGYNDEIEGKLKSILDSFKATQSGKVWRLALGQAARREEKFMAGAKEIRSKIASVQNTQRSLKRWKWSPLPKCVNRRSAWRPAVLMQIPCAK